jgi:hypothetical protein
MFVHIRVEKYYLSNHKHTAPGRAKSGSYRGMSVPEARCLPKLNLRSYSYLHARIALQRERLYLLYFILIIYIHNFEI